MPSRYQSRRLQLLGGGRVPTRVPHLWPWAFNSAFKACADGHLRCTVAFLSMSRSRQ